MRPGGGCGQHGAAPGIEELAPFWSCGAGSGGALPAEVGRAPSPWETRAPPGPPRPLPHGEPSRSSVRAQRSPPRERSRGWLRRAGWVNSLQMGRPRERSPVSGGAESPWACQGEGTGWARRNPVGLGSRRLLYPPAASLPSVLSSACSCTSYAPGEGERGCGRSDPVSPHPQGRGSWWAGALLGANLRFFPHLWPPPRPG